MVFWWSVPPIIEHEWSLPSGLSLLSKIEITCLKLLHCPGELLFCDYIMFPFVLSEVCLFDALIFYLVGHICHDVHVEIRGQNMGVSFLFALSGFWELNSIKLASKLYFLLSHLLGPQMTFFIEICFVSLSIFIIFGYYCLHGPSLYFCFRSSSILLITADSLVPADHTLKIQRPGRIFKLPSEMSQSRPPSSAVLSNSYFLSSHTTVQWVLNTWWLFQPQSFSTILPKTTWLGVSQQHPTSGTKLS